jgi:hypothetical protein
MKTLPEVKPRELLSNHIHIRLTDSDYNQIKARAERVNLPDGRVTVCAHAQLIYTPLFLCLPIKSFK